MGHIVEPGHGTVIAGDARAPSVAELVAGGLDPGKQAAWGACPFCGSTLVIGHRSDGNPRLVHSSLQDAATRQLVPGCERYREVALARLDLPGFMRLCRGAGGITWHAWTGAQ